VLPLALQVKYAIFANKDSVLLIDTGHYKIESLLVSMPLPVKLIAFVNFLFQ